MVLLAANEGIAFLKGVVETWGFWGLTFACMAPFFAFIAYVWKGPLALAAAMSLESALLLFLTWQKIDPTKALVAPWVVALLPALLGVPAAMPELLLTLKKKAA